MFENYHTDTGSIVSNMSSTHPVRKRLPIEQSLNGKHIFVFEDDSVNLAVMSGILSRYGAIIHFDRWGEKTAAKLKIMRKVDIILLDLQIGHKIKGFDVYEEIRSMAHYQTVPIVAVTALDSTTHMKKARNMGFDGYITKPLDFLVFPEYIARLIAGEKIWGQSWS